MASAASVCGLAANNGTPQQQQNQQPSRLKDCAKAYYGLGVDHERAANHDRGDKRQHERVPVESLRPALPRSISDCCSYCGNA